MTRIRRNWSSSRGVEESETPPLLPHAVVTDEVDPDTEARRASVIQLQVIDKDAVLAAESLKSLEHDAVLAAESLKSLEHDAAEIRKLKHERSTRLKRIWGHRVLDGGLSRQGRSENRSCKISSESDPPPDSASNVRAPRRKVLADELQPRSSGIHDKVDSDVSVRLDPIPVLAAGSKVDHLGLQTDKFEKRIGKKDTPIAAHQIVYGGGTGRKKRQRPWESDSDLTLTGTEDYDKERKDVGIHNEVIAKDDRSKLRAKSEKVTEDQRIRDGNKSKIEKVGKVTHGDSKKLKAKSEKRKVESQKVPAESFPLGWKYRGLAQIAERDRATRAREDRCGRTDGRLWQCPLKRKDGFSLCEHHLNKFRLKKLCKSNERAKLHKSDADTFSPQTSDSNLKFKPSTPLDYDTDARTKFRRRHKTAKLSVL